MKDKILRWLFLPVLLGFFFQVPAAAQDDYQSYMREAGGAALLYRGHQAFTYSLRYNGTYWWEKPGFYEGAVDYKGRHYENVLLNIDAARQDLVVKNVKGVGEKVLARESVSSCRFDGKQFLHLRHYYGAKAPDGYWEVLYDGRAKLLKRVTKRLVQDLEGTRQSQTGGSTNYNTKVYQSFIQVVAYCHISESGEIVPIRSKNQLLNLYKSQKREIRRYISTSHEEVLYGANTFEPFSVLVMQYVESR
jgi:hypothetical protein